MTTKSIPYGRYSVVSQSGGHRTLQFSDTSWAQRPFPEGSITVSELNYENRFRGFAVVTPDLQIIRFKAATDSAIACLHALLTGDFESMGLAYAVKSGNCWRCGRELTVPASIHRGMGPICSQEYSEAPKFTFKVPDHISLPAKPGAIVPPAQPAPAPGVKPVTERTLSEKLALRRPENQAPQRRKPGARAYMLSERMIAVEMDWGMLGFERVKNGVKALGFQWKTERRIWWTMLNPANADRIAKAMQDLGIEIDDENVPAVLYEFTEKQRTNRSAATATDADFEATGLREGMELMPFQRAGVKQAVAVRSTIIADEMGLGKTVQALAAIAHLEAFPALVIVPASLKLNWKREIKRWVPDCEVAVLEGKNPKRARFPQRKAVIVVNYDILGSYDAKGNDGETQGWTESGWGRFLADVNWKAIVCDEAHYAKNPRAGRSKAVYELFRQNRTAIRLALTGTPVLNRPAELWPLISMLGYSNAFGGFNGYMKTYCNAYTGDYGYDVSGHANLADLNEALLSSGAMIRRRKEDVLLELPEKRWVTVPVVMGDGEKEYLKAEADCIRWFVELPARRERLRDKCWEEWQAGEGSRFDTFQEFFEASLRDSENKARMAQHLVRFEALKTAAWHAKRDSVYGWISEFLEGSDKKLIVFAHHREAVDALATKFNAVRIQGGMAVEQVEENKRLFQEDPRVRVIVCNIKAGGVGHTLTAASDVAFVEFPWTPADMDQAIDRAHRIGQRDSVTGWVLTAARSSGEEMPTIEDEIMTLLAEKRAVVEAITDGREMPEEMVSILGELTKRWEQRAAALAKSEQVLEGEFRVVARDGVAVDPDLARLEAEERMAREFDESIGKPWPLASWAKKSEVPS